MTQALQRYRDLAAEFLSGRRDAELEAQGRVLTEAAVDVIDGVRIAGKVLPGLVGEAIHGRKDPAMQTRMAFAELRALTDIDDTPGLLPRGLITGTTGLGGGLPFIRGIALDQTTRDGLSPVLPGIPGDAPETVGFIDPDVLVGDGDPITIADVGDGENWHYAVGFANIAGQVRDFTTVVGEKLLDQILFDIADRAAEGYIGANLIAGAGGTTAEGADLSAALDTAEAAASSALDAPADMLAVNPADWPKVRRAVAQSWNIGPAPVPLVSRGVTPGTVLLTGAAAFYLFRQDFFVDEAKIGKNFAVDVAVSRRFYFATRNPDAIQAVTLA